MVDKILAGASVFAASLFSEVLYALSCHTILQRIYILPHGRLTLRTIFITVFSENGRERGSSPTTCFASHPHVMTLRKVVLFTIP